MRPILTATVLAGATMLSACDTSSHTSGSFVMTVPDVLLRVKEVNKENLSPVVTLNGDTQIQMQAAAGREGYTGTINVSPNTNYDLSVVWQEFLPEFDDRFLALARVDKNIFVGETGHVENIGNNEYTTNLDADNDGISNLQERNNNTNPFDENNNSDGNVPNDPGSTTDGSTTAGNGTTTGTDGTSTSGSTTSGTSTSGSTDAADGSDGSTTDAGSDTTAGSDGSTDGGSTDGGTTGQAPTSPTVIIPRISASEAPQIDGAGLALLGDNGQLIDEWAQAVQFDVNGDALLIDNLMIDINSNEPDGTPYRRWAAMHDDERLYIVVLVDDDGARQSDSPFPYDDDGLELFIDGDNSKLMQWGDSDDFHYVIPLQQLATSTASNSQDGRFLPGPNSSSEPLDLIFFTGPGIGPDGIRRPRYEQDVYELSIDLESAGIVPGLPFGLELQVNDDDNGNVRDGKWGWFHPSRVDTDTDTTYMNPSIMGTVVLEE